MARSLWSGAISFGLVNIPVKLYRATAPASAKSVSFHLLHKKCGTRIQNVRRCPHCEVDVPWSDLVKGYEVQKGRLVALDPEELGALLPDEDHAAVAIESFVALDEVDPIYYDRAYYAAPDGAGAAKAYGLLHKALEDSGRVAIARVILRTRSHLAVLRPRERHLLLSTMFYADEIIDAQQIPGLPREQLARVEPRQEQAARQLIDSMTARWEPSRYHDEYAEKVQQMIEQKVAGGEVTESVEVPTAKRGQVIDLLAALRRSLEERRAQGGGPGPERAPARHAPSPRRRPPARRRGATKRRTG